jgi:hypothetical protein
MTVCTNSLDMPLVVTLLTGPPGPPGASGGGGGGTWYMSQFTGDGIKSSFHPISGYSTTDAARYEVVIDGVQQEPNYSFDILPANGGTILFPVAIYSGARIVVRTTNT